MLIYLQDANAVKWQLDATPSGLLRTQQIAGAVVPVILRAPNGACWQLTVGIDGVVGRDAAVASPYYPIATEFYSVSNQRWLLTVDNDGVFGIGYPAAGPALKALPIALLDIRTADGTNYYWGDVAGLYPVVIGAGPNAQYKAWIRSAGPMRRSRDARTDAGDIVVQNITGNTVERDVAAALRDREFAGALAVLRFMDLDTLEVLRRYDIYLGQPQLDEESATFRGRQLADANRVDVPAYDYMAQCPFKYKDKRCSSVSGEPLCPKSYAACLVRAVIHRYGGISLVPQTSLVQLS